MDDYSRTLERSNKTKAAKKIKELAVLLDIWGFAFDAATFRRVALDLENNKNRRAVPHVTNNSHWEE